MRTRRRHRRDVAGGFRNRREDRLEAALVWRPALRQELVAGLREILERANFEAITDQDLEAALGEESLFDIRLILVNYLMD